MEHPNNWRHYYIEYTLSMFTRTCWEHRQCVADVSATFWTLVYLAECSPTVVSCWAIGLYRRWFLVTKHQEKKFHDVPMTWWSMTITRVRRWSFAKLYWRMVAMPWRCPHLCIASHRIRRLEKPCGNIRITKKRKKFKYAMFRKVNQCFVDRLHVRFHKLVIYFLYVFLYAGLITFFRLS